MSSFFEMPPPAYETALGALYKMDALEWLGGLQSQSVDLVIADPPYGANALTWDKFGSLDDYVGWCELWLHECQRVLKPEGSAFICGWSENLAYLKVAGDKVFPNCRWLVWFYRNKHAPWKTDWGRAHESVLHFRAGKKFKFNQDAVRVPYNAHTERYPSHQQGHSSVLGKKGANGDKHIWEPHPLGAKPKDVFEVSVINNGMKESTSHPTQKPEDLIRRFVLASTDKGDLVIDPFGGSGTTFVVAEKLERRWAGTELEDEYIELISKRLSEITPDEEFHIAEYQKAASASARNQAATRNGKATRDGEKRTRTPQQALPLED